jgi:hypothetical protein
MTSGSDREKHDAQKLTDFMRRAEALAEEVERMESSARRPTLKRSMDTIRAIVSAVYQPPRDGTSNL